MGWPNEYNIIQHCGKQKKCCIAQHLFSEKFDRGQTLYNKIQHDKTRYNKVAKRVKYFIKHQSCMMLYEMLYSFGRGFKLFGTVLLGFLVRLSVLRMADGFVTLVDELNLKGASFLAKEVFGLVAEGAGGRRWPIASNRQLLAMSTLKWALAASQTSL